MSSERIIFKFKPSIDIENEYASSEQFISAYFEGIRMLLGVVASNEFIFFWRRLG